VCSSIDGTLLIFNKSTLSMLAKYIVPEDLFKDGLVIDMNFRKK